MRQIPEMADFPRKLAQRMGKPVAYCAIGLGIALAAVGSWWLCNNEVAEPLAWRLLTISFVPLCLGFSYHLKTRGHSPIFPLFLLLFPPFLWGLSHAHSTGTDAFTLECIFYLIPMGLVHFIIFILGCLVLYVISALSKKQCAFLNRRVRRFALFNLLLLFVGCVFSGLWTILIWGNLYRSYDYMGDFAPFWPITRSVLDDGGDMHGELFGISLLELNLVWLAFALGAWAGTYCLYKAVLQAYAPLKQTGSEGRLTAAATGH